jgi:hypothetical protein
LRAPKKNVLKSIVTASSEGRNVREEKKEKKKSVPEVKNTQHK